MKSSKRSRNPVKVTRSLTWAPNVMMATLSKELDLAIKTRALATHPLWNVSRAERLDACKDNLELFGRVYCPHYMEDETPEFHLELYQLAEEAKKRPGSGVVIAAPRGHAKCLSGNMSVLLSNGVSILGRDIQVGDTIMSLNEETLQFETDTIIGKVNSGIKPILDIKTRTGKVISVTKEHRVLTFEGWKTAGDLTVKDRIASPRKIDILPTELDKKDEEVKLLAYMIAEGALSSGNCDFTNVDKQVTEDFEHCCEVLGFKVHINEKTPWRRSLSTGSNSPRDWARDMGIFGHKSYTKRVPGWISQLPERQKWLFVEALMVTDGWFAQKAGQGGITLANEELIDDVNQLFWQLGIIATKRYAKNNKAGAWSLLFGRDGVQCMLDHIDLKQKRSAAEFIVETAGYSLIDTYPTEIKTFPLRGGQWFRDRGCRIDNKYDLTRDKLQRMITLDPVNEWKKLENAQIFWDQVVSISEAEDEETYDVEVEKNHNLITNGLVTHNSTILSFLFPLHELLYERKKNIMIISNTYDAAQNMIRSIRQELETNNRIRADFGNLVGNKWSGGLIFTKTKIKVLAKGTNSQIRGEKSGAFRPDLIIADDIENDDHVVTEEQRKKTWDWWTKVILPAADPKRGTIIFVGTVIHFDSLLAKLLSPENALSFLKKKYQTPKEDGTPLWPSRYPLEKLEQIKADIKTLAYNSEYMNNPIDEETQIYQPKWWKWYVKEDVWFDKDRLCWVFKGEPLEIYQGVDPAIGTKNYSDWFAHITIGVTPSKKILLLWIIKDRIDFPTQVRLISEQYHNWKPKRITIEDAVYQRALRQQLLDNGTIPEQVLFGVGAVPHLIEDQPHFEKEVQKLTRGLRRLASTKHLRIVSRSLLVEQGQVYLRMASTPQEVREGKLLDQLGLPEIRIHKDFYEFIEEAIQFPRAAHDDLLDAWDDALQGVSGMARWGSSWIAGDQEYGVRT